MTFCLLGVHALRGWPDPWISRITLHDLRPLRGELGFLPRGQGSCPVAYHPGTINCRQLYRWNKRFYCNIFVCFSVALLGKAIQSNLGDIPASHNVSGWFLAPSPLQECCIRVIWLTATNQIWSTVQHHSCHIEKRFALFQLLRLFSMHSVYISCQFESAKIITHMILNFVPIWGGNISQCV